MCRAVRLKLPVSFHGFERFLLAKLRSFQSAPPQPTPNVFRVRRSSGVLRWSMELATSAGDTVESLLAKLQARNRVEVGAFRTVFEAHARSQRQARALQERVNALQRQCTELSEGKEVAETALKTASDAAARGAVAQDQSARIAELQAELAASYKQHAESSQQVIAAKEQLTQAQEELAAAKEALAVVERERDEVERTDRSWPPPWKFESRGARRGHGG